MKRPCVLSIVAAVAACAGSAHAVLSVGSSNFDLIARINTLGGTVNQIGGGNNGGVMLNAGSFVGTPDTASGVLVSLPGWQFGTAAVLTDSGASEPGNIASLLTGVPTDLTYTTPGAGGPDGTIGDGSIHFTPGDTATVTMGSLLAAAGSSIDLFIFTNTNSGGTIDLVLFSGGIAVPGGSILGLTVPGGGAGSGTGGVILNIPDGLVYDTIFWTCQSGEVEIDAIAAPIPAPGAAGLVLGLAGMCLGRRRR